MWKQGDFVGAIRRIDAQTIRRGELAEHSRRRDQDTEEDLGQRNRKLAIQGAGSKAIKGLSGGLAEGSAEQRDKLSRDLTPKDERPGDACHAEAADIFRDAACSWGAGDPDQAKKDLIEATRLHTPGAPGIPAATISFDNSSGTH